MRAAKIIGFIIAGVLIIFGFLFILGAGTRSDGGGSWVVTGVILFLISFVIIFFATRPGPAKPGDTNVTYQVDLPANVAMDTLKCKSCGGTLGPENITMVAGAPVVTCPYCHTTYQLTEDPKW
jgi:Na+/melibiose symporter-like transporter